MNIIIANIIDLIAAGIQIGTGAIKSKSKILIMQIIQIFMQGVAMLLLGGITGAISNVFSCIRNWVCYKEKFNIWWKTALIMIFATIAIIFFKSWIDIIPAFACISFTMFMDVKDPIKFKWLVTLSFIPWMIYHLILQSYTGAIFDAVTIVTNAVTLYSMIKSQKIDNKNER